MKSKYITILLLFVSVACENFFHSEEISIGKIKGYKELEQAVNGVYGSLTKAFGEKGVYTPAYAPNIKGDDLNMYRANYEGYYGISNNCWRDLKHEINTEFIWKKLYKTIASANNILEQFNPVSEKEKEIREIIGEVYLIRAYCYFRLTRTYGQIPFIVDCNVDYSAILFSIENIYKFIESDLKAAMILLPKNIQNARYPFQTTHRGVAKAILAEVYLNWAGYPENEVSKYELAMHEANEVIDSATFFGFELLSDFKYLWNNEHYFNPEIVFSLFFANPNQTSCIDEINISYYGRTHGSSNLNTFMLKPDSLFISINFLPVEINFYNNFPSGYRKDITFFSTIYVPGQYFPFSDTGYIHIENVEPCNRIGYRKFYYDPHIIPYEQLFPDRNEPNQYLYLGNSKVYIFRYAHTLLTYAEAAARSGQLNEKAYECVNMIRRRANNMNIYSPSVYDLQPGLSSEAFADSVVWERAWELAGEPEGRWFDLVRLEMVEDLPDLRHPEEGGPPEVFDKSAYFFPIPKGDTDLNPGMEK